MLIQLTACVYFHALSSPNNSDESVHADAGGSFIQSEDTGGHLHLCQWKTTRYHQVCVCLSGNTCTMYRCISVSWPQFSIGVSRWETRVPGEVTTREYRNSDGTFTVQSDYILVPSRERHKETLTCVTTYNEEVFTDSVTLDIQCKCFSHIAISS